MPLGFLQATLPMRGLRLKRKKLEGSGQPARARRGGTGMVLSSCTHFAAQEIKPFFLNNFLGST